MLRETQRNQQNSLFVTAGLVAHRRVCRFLLFFIVYLRRAGELHLVQAQHGPINDVLPNAGQLTPLFESERAEVTAILKSKVSDAPDALRNSYLLKTAARETLISDNFQLRALLEDNFA